MAEALTAAPSTTQESRKSTAASSWTHMFGVVSETILTVVSAVPASTPSRAGDPMTPAEFANVVKKVFSDGKMQVLPLCLVRAYALMPLQALVQSDPSPLSSLLSSSSRLSSVC